MIARHWRGWTKLGDADGYECLLKETMLPQLKQIFGYQCSYVLRHDGDEESEFIVINLFDSLDAIRALAGDNYTVAVFEPGALQFLSRMELQAMHYEVRADTT